MTAKRVSCKHPKLDKALNCKTCGVKVDIREKRNKYGAKRVNGFDSTKEAKRHDELKAMWRAGLIAGWEWRKPLLRYPLEVNGFPITLYEADFRYERNGKTIVEDCKGYKKGAAYRIFIIKKRLMQAIHGIQVQEI
jgi:hypothetical protein